MRRPDPLPEAIAAALRPRRRAPELAAWIVIAVVVVLAVLAAGAAGADPLPGDDCDERPACNELWPEPQDPPKRRAEYEGGGSRRPDSRTARRGDGLADLP